MRIKYKWLWAILGLLGFITIVPACINFVNYAKPYITQAEEQTGRLIKVDSIKIQILPTPRLIAKKLSVSNADNALHEKILAVKLVEATISLRDLIFGTIVIDKIVLDTPRVNLEKDINGKANWELQFNQNHNKSKDYEGNNGAQNAAFAGLLVKNFKVKNAAVSYFDQTAREEHQIEHIELDIKSETVLGPYHIDGNIQLNNIPVTIRAVVGASNRSVTDVMASITMSTDDLKSHSELKGVLDIEKNHLTGGLDTAITTTIPQIVLPNKTIDLQNKPTKIKANIEANLDKISIKDLQVVNEPFVVGGGIEYALSSGELVADMNLSIYKDILYMRVSTADMKSASFSMRSSNYQEIMSWINKDIKVSQPLSIRGIFEPGVEILKFKDTEIKIGEQTIKIDGSFTPATKHSNINCSIVDIEKLAKSFNQHVPLKGLVTLDVAISPLKNGQLLKAHVHTNTGEIGFDGIIGGKSIAEGKITGSKFEVSDYLLDVVGNVSATDKKIDLDLQKLHLRNKARLDVVAKAKIAVDTSADIPHISGIITAQPIQLTSGCSNDFRVIRTILRGDSKHGLQMILNNTSSRWSRDIINLSLGSCSADFTIDVPKLIISGLTLEGLQSKIALKNGKLLAPFSSNLYGGKFDGRLEFSNDNAVRASLKVNLKGVNLSKIPAATEHFSRGIAMGQIDIKSMGRSVHELVQNSEGVANFVVSDGRVKGFDLKQMVQILKKPLNSINPWILEQTFNGSGDTAFRTADAKFIVRDGVAITNDLTIDADEVSLKAAGDIDILNWMLALKGTLTIKDIKSIPPIEFRIKGLIDHPSYHISTKNLRNLMLSKGKDIVSKMVPGLDKIIPGMNGKKVEAEVQPQPNIPLSSTPKERPEKTRKVIKNIMKGLLG